MALSRTSTVLRRVKWSSQLYASCRGYASAPDAPQAPPMLLKLRADLKTAMKAKDTNRLNVLRGLLADITNAAKTPNPVQTDMQVLSLLRKRASAAKAASAEFKHAGREDLVKQEDQQANILDTYAGSVETMGDDAIWKIVAAVVDEAKTVTIGKINMGDVLKKLLGPGGSLEGMPVDKSTVARFVKQALS